MSCLVANTHSRQDFLKDVIRNVSSDKAHIAFLSIVRNRMLLDKKFKNLDTKSDRDILYLVSTILFSPKENYDPKYYMFGPKKYRELYGDEDVRFFNRSDKVKNFFKEDKKDELLKEYFDLLKQDITNKKQTTIELVKEYTENFSKNIELIDEDSLEDITFGETFADYSEYKKSIKLVSGFIKQFYIDGFKVKDKNGNEVYTWLDLNESIEFGKKLLTKRINDLYSKLETESQITEYIYYNDILQNFDKLVSVMLKLKNVETTLSTEDDLEYQNENDDADLQNEIESRDAYDVEFTNTQAVNIFLNTIKNPKSGNFIDAGLVSNKLKLLLDSKIGDSDGTWLTLVDKKFKTNTTSTNTSLPAIITTLKSYYQIAKQRKGKILILNKENELEDTGRVVSTNTVATIDGKVLLLDDLTVDIESIRGDKNLNTLYQFQLDSRFKIKKIYESKKDLDDNLNQESFDYLRFQKRITNTINNLISNYGSGRERKLNTNEITTENGNTNIRSIIFNGVQNLATSDFIANLFRQTFEHKDFEKVKDSLALYKKRLPERVSDERINKLNIIFTFLNHIGYFKANKDKRDLYNSFKEEKDTKKKLEFADEMMPDIINEVKGSYNVLDEISERIEKLMRESTLKSYHDNIRTVFVDEETKTKHERYSSLSVQLKEDGFSSVLLKLLSASLDSDEGSHQPYFKRHDGVKVYLYTPTNTAEMIIGHLYGEGNKIVDTQYSILYDYMKNSPLYKSNIFNVYGNNNIQVLKSRVYDWDAVKTVNNSGRDSIVLFRKEKPGNSQYRRFVAGFLEPFLTSKDYYHFLPVAGKRDRAMYVTLKTLNKDEQIKGMIAMQDIFLQGTKMNTPSKNFTKYSTSDMSFYKEAIKRVLGNDLEKYGIKITGQEVKPLNEKPETIELFYDTLEKHKLQIAKEMVNVVKDQAKIFAENMYKNQVTLPSNLAAIAESMKAFLDVDVEKIKEALSYEDRGAVRTSFRNFEYWSETLKRVQIEKGDPNLTMAQLRKSNEERAYAPKISKENYIKAILPLVEVWFVNNTINSYHLDNIIMGDTRYYKEALTKTKRRESFFSPGTIPSTLSIPETFTEAYIKNNTIPSALTDSEIEFRVDISTIDTIDRKSEVLDKNHMYFDFKDEWLKVRGLKAFENVEQKRMFISDYNHYAEKLNNSTLYHFLHNEIEIAGHRPEEVKQIRDFIMKVYGNGDYDPFDGQGIMLPEWRDQLGIGLGTEYGLGSVVKSIKASHVKLDNGEYTPMITKYSSVVLDDEVTDKYPILNTLRNYMRGRGISELVMTSSAKSFNPEKHVWSYDAVEQDMLKGNESFFETAPIIEMEVPTASVRIQFNPETHGILKQTRVPSQLLHFAKPGIINMSKSRQLYRANAKIYEKYRKNLKEKYGTPEKIANKIVNMMGSSEDIRTSTTVKAMLDNNVTNILGYLGTTDTVVNMIASMYTNEVIDVRMTGAKMVLQSMIGLSEPLSFKRENGFDVAEVLIARGLLPAEIEDYIEKHGEVPVEYQPYVLGFRIPSTEIHSGIVCKVKGFHRGDKNLVIAPAELVKRHGSDFDIDSLFMIKRQDIKDNIKDGKRVLAIQEILNNYYPLLNGKKIALPTGYSEIGVLEDEITFMEKVKNAHSAELISKKERDLIEELYYKNTMVEAMIFEVGSIQNEVRAHKPINLSVYNGVLDEISDKIQGKEKTLFSKDLDLTNANDVTNIEQAIKVGADVTGMGANSIKSLNYSLKTGIGNLNPYLKGEISQMRYLENGKFKTKLLNRIIDDSETIDGESTLDSLDSIVNLAIDNMKELVLPQLNVNPDTFGAFLGILALGGRKSIPLAIKLLRQPIMMEMVTHSGFKKDGLPAGYAKVKKKIDQKLEGIDTKKFDYDIRTLDEQMMDKVFDNYEMLDDIKDPEILYIQSIVLDQFAYYFKIGEELNEHAYLLSLLKSFPVTSDKIDNKVDNYVNLFRTERRFTMPLYFDVNPHIKQVYDTFLDMVNTIETTVDRDSKLLKSTIENSLYVGSTYKSSRTNQEMMDKRNQYIKFINSLVKDLLIGKEEFSKFEEDFIKKVEALQEHYAGSNKFIKNLRVTEHKITKEKYVTFNASSTRDPQYYKYMISEFQNINVNITFNEEGKAIITKQDKKVSDLQKEFLLYSMLISDSIGYNRIEKFIHPNAKAELYKEISDIQHEYVNNPESLTKVFRLFELQYNAANPNNSFDADVSKNLQTFEIPTAKNGIFADAFIEKKQSPNIIRHGKYKGEKLYIKVYESENISYYQILRKSPALTPYLLTKEILDNGYDFDEAFNPLIPHYKVDLNDFKPNKQGVYRVSDLKDPARVTIYEYENDKLLRVFSPTKVVHDTTGAFIVSSQFEKAKSNNISNELLNLFGVDISELDMSLHWDNIHDDLKDIFIKKYGEDAKAHWDKITPQEKTNMIDCL